ncbi:hypothetical protein [Longimicrobium sp.]|uniref:hypothetical protein n=1 Tax=Longimicrobium sp. TaxID=2029185 RepID=UPI003B3B0A6A
MTTFLSLLAAAGLWILYEIAGQLAGGVLGVVLAPVFGPIGRLAGLLLCGWTVALLWMGAIASYGFLAWSMDSPSLLARALGFAAFMGLTPLALMGTFELRHRRDRRWR